MRSFFKILEIIQIFGNSWFIEFFTLPSNRKNFVDIYFEGMCGSRFCVC